MELPPIFAEVAGRETVPFRVRLVSGRRVKAEAVADPMVRGVQAVVDLAESGAGILGLLTTRGLINWQIARPRPDDLTALAVEWAKAAGLGDYGFGRLTHIVRHLDLVEADLQRFYGVDLTAWPRREMTTRRVVALVSGLVFETDSLFWSEMDDRDPLSKEAIVLAQMAGSPSHPHEFLVARKLREEEQKDKEKIARMRERGLSG